MSSVSELCLGLMRFPRGVRGRSPGQESRSGLASFPAWAGGGPCRAVGSQRLFHVEVYEKGPAFLGGGRGKVWGVEKSLFRQKFLLPLALPSSVSINSFGVRPSRKRLLAAERRAAHWPVFPDIHCLFTPALQASSPL